MLDVNNNYNTLHLSKHAYNFIFKRTIKMLVHKTEDAHSKRRRNKDGVVTELPT